MYVPGNILVYTVQQRKLFKQCLHRQCPRAKMADFGFHLKNIYARIDALNLLRSVVAL